MKLSVQEISISEEVGRVKHDDNTVYEKNK